MGGIFGVADKKNCAKSLVFGTDFNTHMLDQGFVGMAVNGKRPRIRRGGSIKEKFEDMYLELMDDPRQYGIGVLSDHEQPFRCEGPHGIYSIATVGRIYNMDELRERLIKRKHSFSEIDDENTPNQTELVSKIINEGSSFEDGIERVHDAIEGAISILILKREGIFAARSRYGHSPLVIGENDTGWAVTNETTAFPNLGYRAKKFLMPGEIVLLNEDGPQQLKGGGDRNQICPFLWIYTGFPASDYEGGPNGEGGINVEVARERCGRMMAKRDSVKADLVGGVPDSGITHAIGYAMEAGIPFRRPLVKYTPSYGRSYTPPSQEKRDMVAEMKLIPIRYVINGNRIVLCEDSIVRGTQLKNQTMVKMWENGAEEVHIRPACPPLMWPCKYDQSTRKKVELVARRAITAIEGRELEDWEVRKRGYLDPNSSSYGKMIRWITKDIAATSVMYQTLDDMAEAIGMPKSSICTYCWNGEGI